VQKGTVHFLYASCIMVFKQGGEGMEGPIVVKWREKPSPSVQTQIKNNVDVRPGVFDRHEERTNAKLRVSNPKQKRSTILLNTKVSRGINLS
jgi:hypothetical protein